MSKDGPIIIYEDDKDENEIMEEAFKRISVANERIFFDDGEKMLHYLRTTSDLPFLIISDINVPRINGLEIRRMIQEDEYLKKKCIPFIFLSTSAGGKAIETAYDLTVQGYFVKQSRMTEIESNLKLIIDYWKECKHPNC
ncbi:MAG TPA: response regulator [Chitinophagaceae bacterium]|jgi:CheY-like chemotaxis protein|nr:response regulator [Chitinophagaceae bacterium]